MAKAAVPDLQTLIESTPPALLKKIRDLACPPGTKGNWMRFLNDKQFMEVFHRLRLGEPANRIVTMCQREWQIKPMSKTGSLARSLRKFRSKAVGEIFNTEVKTDEERKEVAALSDRGQRVTEAIDELEEYAWIIRLQADRIQLFFESEKAPVTLAGQQLAAAAPFRYLDKSIEVFGTLLEKYSRLKQDLGIVSSSRPAAVNVHISAKFKELTGAMDDGQKVAAALNKVAELADENALTLSADEDGKFMLTDARGEEHGQRTELPESAGDSGASVPADGTEPEGHTDS